MARFVEFEEGTEEYRIKVTINPDTVQSITAANYDNKQVTLIVLASGEQHYVNGDYATVVAKLGGDR